MAGVILILALLGMCGWFLYGKSVGEATKRVAEIENADQSVVYNHKLNA